MKLMTKLFKDESGATAIEYGLIAALIAVAVIGGDEAGLQKGAQIMGQLVENTETVR